MHIHAQSLLAAVACLFFWMMVSAVMRKRTAGDRFLFPASYFLRTYEHQHANKMAVIVLVWGFASAELWQRHGLSGIPALGTKSFEAIIYFSHLVLLGPFTTYYCGSTIERIMNGKGGPARESASLAAVLSSWVQWGMKGLFLFILFDIVLSLWLFAFFTVFSLV